MLTIGSSNPLVLYPLNEIGQLLTTDAEPVDPAWGCDFALRVAGDGMAPHYQHGDICLFQRREEGAIGEVNQRDCFVELGYAPIRCGVFARVSYLADEAIVLHALNPEFTGYIARWSDAGGTVDAISVCVGVLRGAARNAIKGPPTIPTGRQAGKRT